LEKRTQRKEGLTGWLSIQIQDDVNRIALCDGGLDIAAVHESCSREWVNVVITSAGGVAEHVLDPQKFHDPSVVGFENVLRGC